MATLLWIGGANAVAQVSTATPANVEINDEFYLYIGGLLIASFTATAATVANVTAGLTASWNAAKDNHPWSSDITASDQTTHVNLTAATAGLPFVVTSSTVNGGAFDTQTLTIATPTAADGPHNWATVGNWWDATNNELHDAIPIGADEVHICSVSNKDILWGLGQSAVQFATHIYIDDDYTGKVGLPSHVFTTSSDGSSYNSSTREYRTDYLELTLTGTHYIYIGRRLSSGRQNYGSTRMKVSMGTGAVDIGTVVVYRTCSNAAEAGKLPCQLLFRAGGGTQYCAIEQGVVGIATDKPSEVSILNSVLITGTQASTRVETGDDAQIASWTQYNGTNILRAGADVTTINCHGGTITADGEYGITTLNVYGGTVCPLNRKAAGNDVSTININGGTVDGRNVSYGRVWNIVNLNEGILGGNQMVTINALNEPSSGRYILQCKE